MFVHGLLLICVSVCVFNDYHAVAAIATTHNCLIQVCIEGFLSSRGIRVLSSLKQFIGAFKNYILISLLSYEAVDIADGFGWRIESFFETTFRHRAFLSSSALASIVLSTRISTRHGALIYVSHLLWLSITFIFIMFYFKILKLIIKY